MLYRSGTFGTEYRLRGTEVLRTETGIETFGYSVQVSVRSSVSTVVAAIFFLVRCPSVQKYIF